MVSISISKEDDQEQDEDGNQYGFHGQAGLAKRVNALPT